MQQRYLTQSSQCEKVVPHLFQLLHLKCSCFGRQVRRGCIIFHLPITLKGSKKKKELEHGTLPHKRTRRDSPNKQRRISTTRNYDGPTTLGRLAPSTQGTKQSNIRLNLWKQSKKSLSVDDHTDRPFFMIINPTVHLDRVLDVVADGVMESQLRAHHQRLELLQTLRDTRTREVSE